MKFPSLFGDIVQYFLWLEHIGLFVFECSLNFAGCALLSPVFGTRSHTTLFTWKQSHALHIPNIFLSKNLPQIKVTTLV